MLYIEIVEDKESFELEIGDSKFTLRRFDSETYRQIEKRYTKKTKNHRTGIVFTETDDYEVNAELLDYMILGWSGIKSPVSKEDVPCTKENKLKLPGSVKVRILEACDADSVTSSAGDEGKGESGTPS